jgi:hypothetical protein
VSPAKKSMFPAKYVDWDFEIKDDDGVKGGSAVMFCYLS